MKRIRKSSIIALFIGVCIVAVWYFFRFDLGGNEKMEIIYFDFEPPKSFDPLEADRAINLQAARMMYLTPIEISVNNRLVSSILKSFEYSKDQAVIKWVINPDLRFEDGSKITSEDVVMSVKRMALNRPMFPVLREIVGLTDWLKETFPLKSNPSGIMVSGDTITIKLNKDVPNPLFRFCLELFSIIPSKCINLESGKMVCDMPPESGYYKLVSRGQKGLEFISRFNPETHGINLENKINFSYLTSEEIKSNPNLIGRNSVLMGVDFGLYSQGIEFLKKEMKFKYLPASLFAAIMINPNFPPFDDEKCRQTFSVILQSALADNANENLVFSSSIFVPIIPGYISEVNKEKLAIDPACVKRMQESTISWARVKSKRVPFFEKILADTVRKLNCKEQVIEVENPSDIEPLFTQGKVAFRNFGSGFWALDPVGDLQMLFTPNLHPMLKFISNDSHLRKLLNDLDEVSDGNVTDAMAAINRYIYKDSKMNVILHTRRFYASRDHSILRELAQGVANPAPWQVFATENR